MAQCVSAMRAPLTWQRSVASLAWSLHACTRVMSYTIAPAYTKLASSAARTVLPTTIQLITPTQCARLMPYRDLRCFTHGSPLKRLHTRYSGSGAYKSSLYMSSSAEHEQYVAAGVILACGCTNVSIVQHAISPATLPTLTLTYHLKPTVL